MVERLDTKGLVCPIPILKLKKAIMRIEEGETLLVEVTDPNSVEDFKLFCSSQGHELIKLEEEVSLFRFHIRKG
ncbi:MAG: sulfurtransferase TusA family protein [Pseudomonadota bacterium]|nr:sulfurtransferase TusA family protein [Pseudomonadota bacterium]